MLCCALKEIPVSFYVYMSYNHMHYNSTGSTYSRPGTYRLNWITQQYLDTLCFIYFRVYLGSCISEDLWNPGVWVKAVTLWCILLSLIHNCCLFFSAACVWRLWRVKTAVKSLLITAALIQLSALFDRGELPLSSSHDLMFMNPHVWLSKMCKGVCVCVCLPIPAHPSVWLLQIDW